MVTDSSFVVKSKKNVCNNSLPLSVIHITFQLMNQKTTNSTVEIDPKRKTDNEFPNAFSELEKSIFATLET